ncbi:MAG TPA: M1 family metallopeptidase [Polyangiaceae bacterium]|nr:M1 family metallopeptidase [Polyangiaceae bacterium]
MPFANRAIYELSFGAGLTCLAGFVIEALPRAAHFDAPATAAPQGRAGYQPTPHAAAPPAAIGPRYDADQNIERTAEPTASYRWVARLDATRHNVSGRGSITWVNRSDVPAADLYFHLYLNAFKNSRTLFLRSPFGTGRSGERATRYGFIDVKRMTAPALGSTDLWEQAARHSPGDPEDETDIRVPLPKPVEPGGELTLEVEFEAQLPEIVERTGYSGSYHFVAQWFPKLAKREADGSWAHFAFHPQSEFYSDFGDYHVTLEVPAGFVVGATGERQSLKRERDRQTVVYAQKGVGDFAWVAWDGFSEREERISGTRVRLLTPRGDDTAVETTLGTLRSALPHFNASYGRYPYETLTVVHPPEHALKSGGMEYPTLITTGSRWYTPFLGIRDLEVVTIHELAHQWFYGLVATNEHIWPFLDEGVTSYAEGWAAEQFYGNGSALDTALVSLSLKSFTRALAAARGQDDVIGKPAREFTSFGSMGGLVYQRTATILDTLGRVYGRSELTRALGRYARYYRFRHPAPPHLSAAIREVLGDRAADNFEQAIFERGSVDYVAQVLQSVPQTEPNGWFDRDGGRVSIEATPAPDAVWISRAVVTRQGTLKFPVDVELSFQDGSRVRKHWSGESTTRTFEHRGPSRLVSVNVDPERRVTLDDNLLNNVTTKAGRDPEFPRESGRFLLQLCLWLAGP